MIEYFYEVKKNEIVMTMLIHSYTAGYHHGFVFDPHFQGTKTSRM